LIVTISPPPAPAASFTGAGGQLRKAKESISLQVIEEKPKQ
jgi:hypothetical protein